MTSAGAQMPAAAEAGSSAVIVAAASASLTAEASTAPTAIAAAATTNARRYPPSSGGTGRVAASTVASTATPTAEPACRWTLNSVVARPVCAMEIAASAAVWAGAIENPNDIPAPNISTGIAQPTSPRPSVPISVTGTAAASRPPQHRPPRPTPPVQPGRYLDAGHAAQGFGKGSETGVQGGEPKSVLEKERNQE